MTDAVSAAGVIPLEHLHAHYQGHRTLSRRVIELFPDDQLFTFSAAPGMRPAGELAWELIGVAQNNIQGLSTADWSWEAPSEPAAHDRAALLAAWDAQTPQLEAALTGGVDPTWFLTPTQTPWAVMRPLDSVQYAIDNEIHHRGQMYVYLRALGIEPPPFWER
jgi:uncharacterized damage-inducible protein DinB